MRNHVATLGARFPTEVGDKKTPLSFFGYNGKALITVIRSSCTLHQISTFQVGEIPSNSERNGFTWVTYTV